MFPILTVAKVFAITDTIDVIKSTNHILDLSDTIVISVAVDEYKSTQYNEDSQATFAITDDIVVVKSTNSIITLSDTIGISSSVSETTAYWEYIGISGSYDESVTYVATGSICAISSVIIEWLQTNYPAANYSAGYVIRVARGNENLSPCSPAAYYYEVK